MISNDSEQREEEKGEKGERKGGDDETAATTWDDLHIHPDLLRGILAYGFDVPSPIQRQAIAPIIAGRDVVAQAQSGTGKTGTFSIASLALIDPKRSETQILVLSPTKELTVQTAKVFQNLSMYMDGVRVQACFGGMNSGGGGERGGGSSGGGGGGGGSSRRERGSASEENPFRRAHPHVICGCPGKIGEMIRTRRLNLSALRLFVLDEADEMLSYDFKEQVTTIGAHVPVSAQVALFSATIPDSLNGIISAVMNNPVRILVHREQLTLDGIVQYYITVGGDEEKYECLKDVVSQVDIFKCIIYCNNNSRVKHLYSSLADDGFSVGMICGDMDRAEREKQHAAFTGGSVRFLVSSDVTARGIDIQQVNLVINFDITRSVDTYLHRIGRSGRWGRKGMAINLVQKQDIRRMRDIEAHYRIQIKEWGGLT